MNMIRILDPDPDQHENLCGSETLMKTKQTDSIILHYKTL